MGLDGIGMGLDILLGGVRYKAPYSADNHSCEVPEGLLLEIDQLEESVCAVPNCRDEHNEQQY